MADSSKKNSVAGKVATPKTGALQVSTSNQPFEDPLEALGKAIGARVRITSLAPQSQTYEGSLFTACPVLNVVILNTRSPTANATADYTTQPGDYCVIPLSRVQSVRIVALEAPTEGSETSFQTAKPSIGPVNVKRLKEREQAKIDKLKEEERNKGKGVTKEAQAIFDSFRRINMPVRWHNLEIIVYESVIIAPPYRVEDCKGPKDKQEALTRVKKVLEGERRKIREREERGSKVSMPTGPRKGG